MLNRRFNTYFTGVIIFILNTSELLRLGADKMKAVQKYEHIEVELERGICLVTLNRPEVRNALVPEMKQELIGFFRDVKSSEVIKVIIVTGKGTSFCAGGNIKGFKEMSVVDARKRMLHSQQLVSAIVELDQPVIAAVNGTAAGAGFSLALACDLILASNNATFTSSFTKIGLVPDLGAGYFLPKLVGAHIAKQIMFSGDPITAEEAKGLRIVNEVYNQENLLAEAYRVAEKLSCAAASAIALTKQLINSSHNVSFKEYLEHEALSQAVAFQTKDLQEGVQAFLEKRPPVFTGK